MPDNMKSFNDAFGSIIKGLQEDKCNYQLNRDIAVNTVDVTVSFYETAHNPNFRTTVSPDPDFPGQVIIRTEELSANGYISTGEIKVDVEQWAKLQYAVNTVFEKTI